MNTKNILITTQKVDTKDPILHFFLDWIREFASHYDTVHVVCLEAGTYTLPQNVIVHSLGKERGASRFMYVVNFYRAVVPLLLWGRVSKIFAHMNEIYILLLIPLLPFRILRTIPIVWWKTQSKLGFFARSMRFFVDHIFTASEHGFKVEAKKKRIVGHGINVQTFLPPSSRKEQSVVPIIAVGRAVPVKHYEDIVRVAGILKKSAQNFRIDIIGVREDDRGPYVNMLKQLIAEEAVENYVHLLPPVPFLEMVTVYQNAEVILSTTYPYTFDKAPLEAMACGVIAMTPTPSYANILRPHGLFPDSREPASLAARLRTILAMTPRERFSIGREMRTHVAEHHNLKGLIAEISAV